MPKSKSLPENALVVETYDELQRYARAFAEGHLNLLVLLGDPGLAKSREMRRVAGDAACWIEGNASAFGIYQKLWEARDQLVVLDDLDALSSDRAGVRLLKCLCQSEPVKTVSWTSDAVTLKIAGIPREFRTSSRVAIIGNEWRTANADVAALEDRGHVVVFRPTALEVHIQSRNWFWDTEIFDFVADHLHLLPRPSMRLYTAAWEKKSAGMDWRQTVLSRCLSGAALLAARIRVDARYATEADRVRAFAAAGGGCRATYFNHVRRLEPPVPAPRMELLNTVPPGSSATKLDVLELMRRRYGDLGKG